MSLLQWTTRVQVLQNAIFKNCCTKFLNNSFIDFFIFKFLVLLQVRVVSS